MKIVVNRCYGGFSVSRKALHRLRELGCASALEEVDIGESWSDGSQNTSNSDSFCRDIPRNDSHLLQVLEELEEEANGSCAELGIIEIPEGVDWEIDEYDGKEHVAEKHRVWY